MKLLITSDEKTFTIYDLLSRQLILNKDKIDELNCPHLLGSLRPTFRPFGITIDEDIYIASNEKIGVFDKLSYQLKYLLNVPLFVNTHQILKDGDILYVCNTSNNSMGIYNLKTKENKFLDMISMKIVENVVRPKNAVYNDMVHFNAMCKHGDKIIFCLNYQGVKNSEYYFYNPLTDSVEFIVSSGLFGHNIKIKDNHLYSLSSHKGELIRVNLQNKMTKHSLLVDPFGVFMRGMDWYDDNNLLIAYSANRKNISDNKSGSIYKFNIHNTRFEKFLELENIPYINDIAVF